MNILIVIDKNYLCYLQCLLESWKRNYTQGCFQWIIYFIQPYDQPEDRKTLQILYHQCDIFTKIWKDRYGSNKNNKVNFSINIHTAPKEADNNIIPIGLHHNGKRKLTRFMAYCANIRTMLLPKILKTLQDDDILLYLDVDAIIRGDLYSMNYWISQFDLMIYYCSDTYKRARSNHQDKQSACKTYLKSGLIGIKKNTDSLDFFTTYYHNVLKLGLTNWGSDQQALVELVELYTIQARKIEIGYWSPIYMDWHFNKNSVIWMGKGTRKDRDKVYLEEYHNYSRQWRKRYLKFNRGKNNQNEQ